MTPRRRIALYLLLVFSFSSVFYALIIATGRTGGGHGAYAIGLMWCPALAGILCCRLTRLELGTLGWSWGAWRWQWAAYLVPLCYTAIAYGIVYAMGLASFPDPAFIAWARKSLAWGGVPDTVVLVGDFALVATTGLVANVVHALGEEIGWRGFLTPQANEAFGVRCGALLTGAIWTVWHLPILLFADYNAGTPWWYAISCFAVLVTCMSVIMAWLRTVSGSMWTAAIFHASHNLFIQSFFTPATAQRGAFTPYAIDEFGFAVPCAVLALAVWCWNLPQIADISPVENLGRRRGHSRLWARTST